MTKIKSPEVTFSMNRMLKEDCEYIISKRTDGITFESFINEIIGNYVDEYFSLNESPEKHMKKCPKCGKYVRSRTMIEKEFGWRNIGDKNIPQSHCRQCRMEELKSKTMKNQINLPEEGEIE